ncbi:MAG: HEAT repeat domain-containing protein [Chloroflexus sp.]
MSERSAERPELHFVPRALRDLFLPRRMPREVRAAATQWLNAEPLAQLLPAAFELPFGIELDPVSILSDPRHLAIIGPAASGRSLALAQIARRWLDSSSSVPLVRLTLSEIDTLSLTPRAITARVLARLNLAPNPLEHNLPCLLLIDDWEMLPLARRAIWQRFLTRLPERWPQAHVVVTLPPGELWPSFRHHAIAPLSSERLEAWISCLFPHSNPDEMLAMFERDPLVLLRERPAEMLMLALTQPLSGWPVSRVALYERMAAFINPILATASDQTHWRIGHAAYHLYRQAVALASQSDPDPTMIQRADAHWRALCVPLAFGAAPDPRPLMNSLANANLNLPERLLLLARALRERPRLDPALSRPIIDEICQYGGDALAMLAPALPVILIDIGRAQPAQLEELLERILARLAPAAGTNLLIALLDASDAPPSLRWQAIELLCRRQSLPPPLPTYADLISQAGRCLLASSRPDTVDQLANPALHLGLRLLLSGAAGEERQRQIARHLLDRTTLPASVRALAPAALTDNELVRAASDSMAEVRQAARAIWLRAGQTQQLARFITQPYHPWLARDEALADLATHPAGHTTLAGFALSRRLPLDLRLRAIYWLSRSPNGTVILKRLLTNVSESDVVRAAAARGLARQPQSVTILGPLLESRHPPLLRRAVAKALEAIASTAQSVALTARATLLAALAQPELDATLTVSIVTAIGQYGARTALAALGRLLAPAYGVHLLEAWIAALPALIGPEDQWLTQAGPTATRALLADLIVTTEEITDAAEVPLDRPSALIARHVLRVSSATVSAISVLGRRYPALEPAITALIDVALHDTSAPRPLANLLAALPHSNVAAIARSATTDLPLRIAALQALAAQPASRQYLIQLARTGDDDLACNALNQLTPPFSADITAALLRLISSDRSTAVRLAALQAVGRCADPALTPTLLSIATNEQEAPTIRTAALDAAVNVPVSLLIEWITTQSEPMRSAALRALSRSDQPAPAHLLHRLAFDAERACALAAVNALARQGEATTAILSRIVRSHPDLTVRLTAAAALRHFTITDVVAVCVEALHAPYPALQTQAFALLADIEPTHPALRQPLIDAQAAEVLRFRALQHLSTINPADPYIHILASDPEATERLRCHAIAALAQQDDPATIDLLRRLALADDASPRVRYTAVMALDQHCAKLTNAAALAAMATLASSAIPEVALWVGTSLLERLVPITTPAV